MRSVTGAIAFAALLAAVGGAAPALAAETDAKSAADETDKPKLVVVSDARESVAENAHLRAVLYDAAREAGYDAAGKLDVEEAAGRASAMKAGVISSEPRDLAELRRALGVAVLVRVTKTDSGVRLSVVNDQGTQQKDVLGGNAGDDTAVSNVMSTLLPAVYRPDGPKPVLSHEAEVGRIGPSETPKETLLGTRESWEARGGLRPMYGAELLASGTIIRHVAFSSAGRSGEANAQAVGGGVGVRVGFMYLPIPDPKLGVGSFAVVRFGVGLDTNVLYARFPHGYDSGGQVSYKSRALWVSGAPAYLGFAIASGRFLSETSWHGVLIGFGYAPAAQFSMDLRDTSGKFRFNPAGAELSVDITKFETENGANAEPQIRLAVSGLMPMDDARPGFLTLGIGAIWY